jgi:mannitol-1-phosphate 5-dehydrogenase
MKDSVVIFGAGAVGRGFIGRLLVEKGMAPVFVEADLQSARSLQQTGGYTVHLTGTETRDCCVTGYRVLTPGQQDEISKCLADCLFAATSVGGQNLKAVAWVVASGLQYASKKREKPLNILVCENWPDGDKVLAQALLGAGCERASFACVRCSVERIVRRMDSGLDLIAESGRIFYVDSRGWKGKHAANVCGIDGLAFSDNIEAIYARKLFTSNAGGAALAYLGSLSGCYYIHEALGIPETRKSLTDLLNAAKQALTESFSLNEAELKQHLDELMTARVPNRDLADTVQRVGRNPLRKLGSQERLAGLAKLLRRCSLAAAPACRVIGAALHYRDPADPESLELGRIIAQRGAGAVLKDVCGFTKEDKCFDECLAFYDYYA